MINAKSWCIRSGLLVLFFLLTSSCGSDSVETPIDPPPATQNERYQLFLFSAPWCTECSAELTQLRQLWAAQPQTFKTRVQIKMYVVTGPNKERPTDEMAQTYRNNLELSFDAVADPWRWKTYRTYIQNTWNLPAAVIVSQSGELQHIFVAPPSYAAQELIDYLYERLKR